jgi:hypothetical protein
MNDEAMLGKIGVALAIGTIGAGMVIGVGLWFAAQTTKSNGPNSGTTTALTAQRPAPTRNPSAETVDFQVPASDKSELDLVVGNVAVLIIIDPTGLRTGRDSSTSGPIQEIPQSIYSEDSIGNNSEGAKEIDHFLDISQPKTGVYFIMLTSVRAGDFQLSIRAVSKDGTSQHLISESGHLKQGSRLMFKLNYSSVPGAVSSLTRSSTE